MVLVLWAEIKDPRNVPYAQKAYFSQMLCTNLFTSLLVSISHLPSDRFGILGRVPLFSVCVLLTILLVYWPVWDVAFSLQLCLEGQHPGVASSLLTLRRVFCGYYLMKLPVEDLRRLFLKLDTLMYLSSCSVVHRGLPLLFLFWLEPVCAVLWRE